MMTLNQTLNIWYNPIIDPPLLTRFRNKDWSTSKVLNSGTLKLKKTISVKIFPTSLGTSIASFMILIKISESIYFKNYMKIIKSLLNNRPRKMEAILGWKKKSLKTTKTFSTLLILILCSLGIFLSVETPFKLST